MSWPHACNTAASAARTASPTSWRSTGQVRSAKDLTQEQQERLVERLSAFSGKQVRLEVEVDEALKAGFVARLGDQVFDGTLEAQVHRLRRRLAIGL